MRRLVFSVVCCAALLGSSAESRAQEITTPAEARFHLGPLALQPRFKVTNVGVDTNVLNASTNPVQDFTATFIPEVDNYLPLGRARFTGRTSVGFVYFATLAEQRSIDFSQQERVTFQLTHVTPRIGVNYINSDQRPNQEIDARVHRTEINWGGGLSARLSPKVGIDVGGTQSQFEFADVDYRGVSLATVLDRTTRVIGGKVSVDLTPLTTFGVQANTGQDRFPTSPERNSDHTDLSAGVNLKRSALLSGTANVGVKWFRPHDPSLQNFTGLTADVGLTYLLHDRTQVTGRVGRGTDYSFEVEQPYYISTTIGLSVTQMIVGHMDVVGRVGRTLFDYRSFTPADGSSVSSRRDRLGSFGFGVGYRMSAGARIGVDLSYDRRQSPIADRQYEGFRLGGSFIYGY